MGFYWSYTSCPFLCTLADPICTPSFSHAVLLLLGHFLAFQYFATEWHPFQEVSLATIHLPSYLALLPGPAQLSVACSTENRGRGESLGMRLPLTHALVRTEWISSSTLL